MERSEAIHISESLDETTLRTLADCQKHFTDSELVEIVKRYINMRFMQRKAMKKQLAKMKELKQWGREQGVWGKKDDE